MLKRSVVMLLSALMLLPAGTFPVRAASHREAPITSLDHPADITDFYAFVSYDDPTKVTFILGVDPLLDPGNGPTYFPFDPSVRYAIKIDNDNDGIEDITFEFEFQTEIRTPGIFTVYVGAGKGLRTPSSSPPPVPPGTPLVPPAITALNGPGSEGLILRQAYNAFLRRGLSSERTSLNQGQPIYAVPSNVGPRTMPDYPSLAAQGIYNLPTGVRVFAGTVDDPFWIDLGAAFDSLNFRSDGFLLPGVLTDEQDADDANNYAADNVSGYNMNAIAIEVPITMLTRDGQLHTADEVAATIGAWGVTYRPRTRAFSPNPGDPPQYSADFTQIQRMGNPLINELLIPLELKDKWSQSQPKDDADFATYALDPLLARVLNAIYGDALPIPTPPRLDLLPLVQYMPPIAPPDAPRGPVADLLRLNTGVPPTPAETRRRLGLLAGDAAGFPNGRRVSDDVTDITSRAVVGVLTGDARFTGFPHNRIGDGVNTNDVPYQETFPYVGWAQSGRNSRHLDPGEPGGGPIN